MFSDRDWIVEAVVEASPDDAFAAIVASRQDEMNAHGPRYAGAVTVDRGSRVVSVRGHWWYHGTHTVTGHPQGSMVTYEVRNVGGPLAYLDKPFYQKSMQRDLDALLATICKRIGCASV